VSIVEDDTGLLGEERSTNAMPIEEAWEVSLEENAKFFSSTSAVPMEEAWEVSLEGDIKIFNNMEEGALSTSDIQEGMKIVPYMKRM